VGTDLPVGTTCTFVERDVPSGVAVTYDPANAAGTGGEVVIPADRDASVSVSITNTYTTGSLVIRKAVSGPGAAAFGQGPFVFDVRCGSQGVDDVYSTEVVVAGSN